MEFQTEGGHFTKANKVKNLKIPLAREFFDFGIVWMLREVELAAIRHEHIKMDFTTRRVSFTLPVSKTDQKAVKTTRVLQCLCEDKVRLPSCPWFTSARLVDGVMNLDTQAACINVKKNLGCKAQLIADWRRLFDPQVSGHSARRAGALRYIHLGWAIPRVAYLGRWRSNVIYEYVQEALASLPANQGHAFGRADHITTGGSDTNQQQPNIHFEKQQTDLREDWEEVKNYFLVTMEAVKTDQNQAFKNLDAEVENFREKFGDSGTLPKLVQSTASKVIHLYHDIATCSPPFAWKTLCGWHYAKSEFVFLNQGTKSRTVRSVDNSRGAVKVRLASYLRQLAL